DLRLEAVPAYAVLVEHERDAAGDAHHPLNAPRLRDGAIRIGEQRERQLVILAEPRVRRLIVARHADHLGAGGDEVLVLIAEAASLARAAERLVLRIEVHDERL